MQKKKSTGFPSDWQRWRGGGCTFINEFKASPEWLGSTGPNFFISSSRRWKVAYTASTVYYGTNSGRPAWPNTIWKLLFYFNAI